MKFKIIIVLIAVIIFAYINNLPEKTTPKQPEIKIAQKKPEIIPPKQNLPDYIKIPTYYNHKDENPIYNDVLNHSPEPDFGDKHGKNTNVHETTHGINNYYRNKYHKIKPINAFYCLDGNIALVDEPDVTLKQVSDNVPRELREYRFELYLTGQQQRDWNNRPLYIFDEWSAYITGSLYNVNNHDENQKWTDGVSGTLEFAIYGLAVAMTIKEHDPEYWKNNQQFKKILIHFLKLSDEIFTKGHELPQFIFPKSEQLLERFRNNQKMQTFIKGDLGVTFLAK